MRTTQQPATPVGDATLYTYDRATGQHQVIATSSGSDGDNWWASMSNDGQHVVFQSDSDALDTLAGGTANGHMDIFVWDRGTNTITGITENALVHSDGASLRASISANGDEIIFASDATNLVPGDTNGQGDTFVYDRPSNTIKLVSVASDGTQGDGDSTLGADISHGGPSREPSLAFGSTAGNLVTPADTDGGQSDVFVVDRTGGIIGGVTEDDTTPAFAGAPAGTLSNSRRLQFLRRRSDRHSHGTGDRRSSRYDAPPGFLPVPPGGLGTFTPTLVDTGGTGHGQVAWTFTVDNAAVQALNGDQRISEVYTVQIDDGHGGVVTQDVTIVIGGTNDAPVANADTGAVNEDATRTVTTANGVIQGTTGGSVADTDVDNATNTLLVSGVVAGTGAVTQGVGVGSSIAGTYGHLTLHADGSYSYVADTADSLPAGAAVVDTFTYTDKDPSGAVSNATTLTITVTGTNDAPAGTSNRRSPPLEDTAYTFAAADFGFSDPNDTPANNSGGREDHDAAGRRHADRQRRGRDGRPVRSGGRHHGRPAEVHAGGQRQRRDLRQLHLPGAGRRRHGQRRRRSRSSRPTRSRSTSRRSTTRRRAPTRRSPRWRTRPTRSRPPTSASAIRMTRRPITCWR